MYKYLNIFIKILYELFIARQVSYLSEFSTNYSYTEKCIKDAY